MATWLVPVLRNIIAALVALLAAWIAKNLGIEVTDENKAFLTTTLTTAGMMLIGMVQLTVSKWMKGWFLRNYHAPLTAKQVQTYGERA